VFLLFLSNIHTFFPMGFIYNGFPNNSIMTEGILYSLFMNRRQTSFVVHAYLFTDM